jgi:transglutaminase-like putative cysteine protease
MNFPRWLSVGWAAAFLLNPVHSAAQAPAIRDVAPAVPTPERNQNYVLEIKPSRSISTRYTYKVHSPNLKASEWTLFTPRPPVLSSQRILQFESTPRGEITADQSPLKQSILRVRNPVRTTDQLQSTAISVRIDADLYSRRLILRNEIKAPDAISKLTDPDRALFLRTSPHFNYQSAEVIRWMNEHDLQRKPDEGEIDFARRVFQFIARNFGYEYLGNQNRCASNVCTVGKSDCGGLAVLFCTVLRSQAIPARTLAGRWAVSDKPDDRIGKIIYHQEHVKAEFFAQGVGWVPADVSSAVLHDKSSGKLAHFGNDQGDFLTLHLDSDLRLDTGAFGVRPMTLLQRPCYWVTGRGSTDHAVVGESWTVTPIR